eukprot:4887975-Pleurochrysis_carterae.AAC.2
MKKGLVRERLSKGGVGREAMGFEAVSSWMRSFGMFLGRRSDASSDTCFDLCRGTLPVPYFLVFALDDFARSRSGRKHYPTC